MRFPTLFLAFVLVATGLPAQGTLSALDYTAPLPAGWIARQPSSGMRLAEYVVDGPAPNAEVVVYFFGEGQGGSPQANIERWRGQFSMPDGSRPYEKIERDAAAAFPLSIAEWRGTYARGIGPGGTKRPDHALVAAILETPRGTLFFQLFGPAAKVAAARPGYLKVVRALR